MPLTTVMHIIWTNLGAHSLWSTYQNYCGSWKLPPLCSTRNV